MSGRDSLAYIKGFLVDADPTRMRCVDERLVLNPTRGIQLPGATSGIVDALKVVLGLSEDEAWQRARDKGLPMDGHDDDRSGPGGCGYNQLIETRPASVGALEPAAAAARLARVHPQRVLHSVGAHAPVHAIINHAFGRTLDTNGILADGAGTFNLDAWALPQIADALGLLPADKRRFTAHVLDAYLRAIAVLTDGTIRPVALEE